MNVLFTSGIMTLKITFKKKRRRKKKEKKKRVTLKTERTKEMSNHENFRWGLLGINIKLKFYGSSLLTCSPWMVTMLYEK